MKKILALTLATVMMMTMVSCGKKEAPAPAPAPAPSTSAPAASSAPEAEDNFLDWKYDTTEILCPLAAGGGTDLAARIVAQGLSEATGKNFIITNNTNGSGAEVYYDLSDSEDCSTLGYTLASYFSTYWTGIHDAIPGEDIVPVSVMENQGTGGSWFVVPADSPFNTFEEILEYTKANPGKLTFGVPTSGINFFQAYEMKVTMGFDCRFVDAAGDAEKMTGLLGGTIDVIAVAPKMAAEYATAGDVKVLTCLFPYDNERVAEVLHGTPSFEDLGLPSPKCATGFLYLLASSKADPAEIEQLNKIMEYVMTQESIVEAINNIGQNHVLYSVEDGQANFAAASENFRNACESAGLLAAGR